MSIKLVAGTPKTFKGSVSEVGTVIGAKDKNFKENFQNLQRERTAVRAGKLQERDRYSAPHQETRRS